MPEEPIFDELTETTDALFKRLDKLDDDLDGYCFGDLKRELKEALTEIDVIKGWVNEIVDHPSAAVIFDAWKERNKELLTGIRPS